MVLGLTRNLKPSVRGLGLRGSLAGSHTKVQKLVKAPWANYCCKGQTFGRHGTTIGFPEVALGASLLVGFLKNATTEPRTLHPKVLKASSCRFVFTRITSVPHSWGTRCARGSIGGLGIFEVFKP